MRGVGNNNPRGGHPFGQMPRGAGGGNNNMAMIQQQQQQQQMMLMQQQFLARQQIIQQEQLQKQRLLRQEEEKQAGLMAAIRDLQQKTLQQNMQQQQPQLPQQQPQLPHLATLPGQRPPFSLPTSTMLNQPSSQATQSKPTGVQNFNADSARIQNTLLRGPGQLGSGAPRASFVGQGSQTAGLGPAGRGINSVPNIPQSTQPSTQHLGKFPRGQPGSTLPAIFSTPPPINNLNLTTFPPPNFNRPKHSITSGPTVMPGHLVGGSLASQLPSATTSLPAAPGITSHARPSLLGRHPSQTSCTLTASNKDSVSRQEDSRSSLPRSSSSSSRLYDKDRRDRDESRRRRDDGSRDSIDRDRVRSDGRSSRHMPDRGSSLQRLPDNRHRERPGDLRSRSVSISRNHDRHRSGSRDHSQSRDSSYRQSVADRGGSDRDGVGYAIDRSPARSVSRQRERDGDHSRTNSRERSVSQSRSSRSSYGPEAGSRERISSRRELSPSPSSGRNTSDYRRDRKRRRSRSPSQSSELELGSVNSQLSQYRQDLMRSEHSRDVSDRSSPKRRRADVSTTSDNVDADRDEDQEDPEVEPVTYFTRSCPADLYFVRHEKSRNMEAKPKMVELENKFEDLIIKRAEKVKVSQVSVEDPPLHPPVHHHHHHHHHHCSGNKSSSSCDSSSSSEDEDDQEDDDEGSCSQIMEEWDRRKKHPYSLHPELWFNIKGQANDGPLCRCSIKSRQSGIRHEIYPGEAPITVCEEESSNLDKLFHYRVTMSPYTNFLTKVPTLIHYDNHEYIFEGFSMFSHVPLENIPPCKLLRFNIEYTIHFIPETAPENFTIRSLNLFNKFIFTEILELIDMDWTGPFGGCNRFHFMPRFCRTLPDSGCKEVLSMNTVLNFLLKSAKPLVEESRVDEIMGCGESEWHAKVDHLRGMIVTNPGMRPSSLRIDQLDRKVTTPVVKTDLFDEDDDEDDDDSKEKRENSVGKSKEANKTEEGRLEGVDEVEDGQPRYPLIIHQGYRPAQLSYAGDPVYRKAWKQYVKFRHLLNSKPKILQADKMKLKEQEEKLREIRMKKTMKREVTIELSSKDFLCTGLRADLCQHALMIPVLMSHLRFHICLGVLEDTLDYKFDDRNLLQLSLTHTSYRTNYGTNPDHARNSLTNCGMRQVEYGDRRIHYQNTRKRGICILVDIMSRMGKQEETVSEIPHNERLEFLGDAVIEFLTSVHLFYMFPWLEEGGLTTYRMALVQNQHLAIVARKLKLQDFMLYVHGPDLCHESDLRHAMANCCEAIMGALFLDGGIEIVDRIFSKALFDDEDILLHTWNDIPKHVLQQEEPGGDRHWVKSSPILQKLEKFEEMIGVKYTHIRLLAKAFTHRNIGVNPLTLGHNQRLEFLGDTVLQLVASEYLYKHYPEHHEGHLSLLRSSLVNSRTQGLVYDDLGMSEFVICNENAVSEGLDMKTKQRADILESFVGSLFVDKDLDYCRTFCNVCFFPRLKDFIMNQDWNDPKSQLQQCCLTLREVGGGEPDIPVYKVIKSIGPTNTRKYVVAVYFRGKRLARGTGHSIQQAEMAAATQALKKRAELFPILQHQRRFLERVKNGGLTKENEEGTFSSPKRPKRSRQSHRQKNAGRRKAD